MLIDVHTHAFPDAIAGKTIEVLKAKMLAQSGVVVENATDGTVGGLVRSMNLNGVDLSFVMPIATKVSQTATINNFAEGLRDDKLISFGSVHPEDPDYDTVLKNLKERGFLGIKLHPEFQSFFVDSPEGIRLIKTAHKYGLYTLLHAGGDLGYPAPYHCTPERLKNIAGEVDPSLTIAAHLGGFQMWEDVMKFIPDTGVYIDTAAVGHFITPDVYRDIIHAVGPNRVLFGSDSPWEDSAHALACLEATKISADELDMIKYKNAVKLFGIEI